jgi:hypothetical protein
MKHGDEPDRIGVDAVEHGVGEASNQHSPEPSMHRGKQLGVADEMEDRGIHPKHEIFA